MTKSEEVRKAILKNPAQTNNAIAEAVGCDNSIVSRQRSALKASGDLTPDGKALAKGAKKAETKVETPKKAAKKETLKGINVVVEANGSAKLSIIKVVKERTGLGLKEAKDLVDGVPYEINCENEDDAELLVEALNEAGATASVKGNKKPAAAKVEEPKSRKVVNESSELISTKIGISSIRANELAKETLDAVRSSRKLSDIFTEVKTKTDAELFFVAAYGRHALGRRKFPRSTAKSGKLLDYRKALR